MADLMLEERMHRPSVFALILAVAVLGSLAVLSRPAVAADDNASVDVGDIELEPGPTEGISQPESEILPQPETPEEVTVPKEAPPEAEIKAEEQEKALEEKLQEETPGPGGLPKPVEVPAPIVSIEIEGNVHVPAEDIRAAIKSQVGGQFSETQVAEDRTAVLRLGWFQRVSVERESAENGIRVIFHVVENPVIEEIEFKGNTIFTREQLLAVMKTKPDQVYNAPLISADAAAIEKLYQSLKYILAIVVGQSMEEGVLTLEIAEGVIESVKITGNTRTKTPFIQHYIRTKPGDVYNENRVQADVARLMAQGLFETVRRDAEVGTEPGTVIVVFTVVEKRRTGMVSVGGGYSSVQGLVGFIDLSKANLGGTGQVVSIRAEFGGQTSYELGYQNPWIMTPETRMSLGIYDRLILREAFVTDAEGNQHNILYDERRSGGNVTFGRPLSDVTTVFLGLRADDVSIADISTEDEQYLTGPAFEPRKVRSITLAGVNDTRNGIYNPTRGEYDRLSAEFAGLLFGGTEFNKYVLDARRYVGIGKTNERGEKTSALAFRLLTGVVTGEPPYLEQFLVGGSESLRGFRTDRFVGTKMAILNAEYRRPIGKSDNLIGVLFVDVGDAWGGALTEDPAFSDVVHSSFKAHVGYGVGVRVKTPIGPLRLDLGFSDEGTETHFGVRNTF